MEQIYEKRKIKTGKLLISGVAFLIVVAFLQTGFRRGIASGAQKGTIAIKVTIDVNPGGSKLLDLGSDGYLRVAVLGSKEFNVASIDPQSISFGGAKITKARSSVRSRRSNAQGPVKFRIALRDVNKDGIMDLVAKFPIPFLSQLKAGTATATLTARLLDGRLIEGSQTIQATGESVINKVTSPRSPTGTGLCNTTPIVFPDDPPGTGDATPYPSTINVTGLTGIVTDVTVTLNGITHTFPNDLDILLVAPNGKAMVLVNQAWDGTAAVNQDVTFSDAAPTYVPVNAPLVTGTYRPASYFSNISFNTPAPPLTTSDPYGATFKTFRGISPNGDWSLYATDVVTGDTGSIAGGWCINVQTAQSAGCPNQLFTGSLTKGDAIQTGALFRDVFSDPIAGLCGTPKVCPGVGDTKGDRFYDPYTITNNSGASTCVTATVTGDGDCAGNLFLVAYQPSFDPSNLCANYLDDPGTFLPDIPAQTQTMSFDLAAGASVVLVVQECSGGEVVIGNGPTSITDCASYGLLVEGDLCASCTSITCPANIARSNDPNQCGAVTTFPDPTPNGSCGTITCSPASGSFFPKGTTTVTCTSSAGPTCTFTVTVNDTQPPTITCPANQTKSNDPNQCGAVVNYPAPTVSDNCPGVGSPTCSPASGSFFPKGTTTVTCTVADMTGNTASCTFTVTVNDTQPPMITCPPNITAVTNQAVCPPPGQIPCQVVNFAAPTASDNCPGVTVVCNPPSGSCLPAGTTTVTCTATDTSMNTATCSFTVTVFDVCLQDDSNPARVLLFNSFTGDYRFCCDGTTFTGRGKVTKQGCIFTLEHNPIDRRVRGTVDKAAHAGNASLQSPPGKLRCTITDSDIRNNTCTCQ